MFDIFRCIGTSASIRRAALNVCAVDPKSGPLRRGGGSCIKRRREVISHSIDQTVLTTLTSSKGVREHMEHWLRCPFAWDFETSGLNHRIHEPVGLALTFSDT